MVQWIHFIMFSGDHTAFIPQPCSKHTDTTIFSYKEEHLRIVSEYTHKLTILRHFLKKFLGELDLS